MSHIIKRLRVIVLTGAVLLTSTGAALAASPWLLHVWGGSGDDGSGVELAGDEVDHRDEVAVGAVPAGSALSGLDK